MTREDSIYFEEKEEDTGLNHCARTRKQLKSRRLKNGKECHILNNPITMNIS